MRLAAAFLMLAVATPAFAQERTNSAPEAATNCERHIQGNRFILNPENNDRVTEQQMNAVEPCFRIWAERVRLHEAPSEPGSEGEAQALIDCAPAAYAAALDCLARHLPARVRAELLGEDGVTLAHFGLGMFLRNNWGLWNENRPLVRAMREMGFSHPDDMSAVILEGFVARERGQPYDLAAKAAEYRAYWEDSARDVRGMSCPIPDTSNLEEAETRAVMEAALLACANNLEESEEGGQG